MHDSKIESRLKAQLTKFCSELCTNLSRPRMLAVPKSTSVQAVVHLDVKALAFRKQYDRRTQALRFIAALLDENGEFVTGKEGVIQFSLKEATYTDLLKDGMNFIIVLPASAGRYRLRAVVQESVKGGTAATTIPVQLQ